MKYVPAVKNYANSCLIGSCLLRCLFAALLRELSQLNFFFHNAINRWDLARFKFYTVRIGNSHYAYMGYLSFLDNHQHHPKARNISEN